jgi:hypothetical protein
MRVVRLHSRPWFSLRVGAPFFRAVPLRAKLLILVLLLAAAASARPLLAQTVRGRMLEAASGAPVAGALVELRSSAGRAVDAVLTDEGGRFALQARAAGTYRLHAERIGYSDWDSEPFRLASGESAARTIRLPAHPISLSALSVEAERTCRLARDQGEATASVWAEVRKALRFTLMSQEDAVYRYIERDFTRELDDQGGEVRTDEVRTDTTLRARSYAPVPADELASQGFVRGTIEKGRTFYAPGVETLLSDAFLATHCIVVEGTHDVSGEPWIGVRFEPLKDRSVPEVAGSLWLAADGSELRELDFQYVNVELPPGAAPHQEQDTPRTRLPARSQGVGGHVAFSRLPSGRWIVRDWEITMPKVAATAAWWKSRSESALVLMGFRRRGGEVLQVSERGGRVLFQRDRATLRGVVFDSTRGTRLAGALVRLEGTGHVDTTDAQGRFGFSGLDGGDYTAVVRGQRLDALGLDSLAGRVILREGSVTEAAFGVPGWRTLLARGCAAGSAGPSSGIVVGLVRDPDSGEVLAGATVAVLAGDSASAATDSAAGKGEAAPAPGGAAARSTLTTGADGTFAFCGLPGPSRLRMAVRAPGRPPVQALVRVVPADTFLWVVDVPASAGTWIAGQVQDEKSGRPVASASVRLSPLGAAGASPRAATTDSVGAFTLADLAPGRYAVNIDASAYGTAADTVLVREGTGLRLDVHLGSRVMRVAPIHVEVVGAPRERASSAFNTRASHVYGMNEQQVAELRAQSLALKDLIRRANAPGFSIFIRAQNPYDSSHISDAPCVHYAHTSDPYSCAVVYIDDIELDDQQATSMLQTLTADDICSFRLIPPVEAGARFGTGASRGVLLVYTTPCR